MVHRQVKQYEGEIRVYVHGLPPDDKTRLAELKEYKRRNVKA
jgi:hypothetical protein